MRFCVISRNPHSITFGHDLPVGHPLQNHPIDFAGGVQRHFVENGDLLRRLVADSLAGKANQLCIVGRFAPSRSVT